MSECKGAVGEWFLDAPYISGFLFDVYGVLFDSGISNVPVDGSVEAIKMLKEAGVPMRFCSNMSTQTTGQLADTLQAMGFGINADEIFAPAPAVKRYMLQHQLRPLYVVHPDVMPEFAGIDQSAPNCVVLGDAQHCFTYDNMNSAFQLLMQNRDARLLTMGKGMYYKETDGLKLDVGAYAKALEYACDVKSEVFGKPSKHFFMSALADLAITPDHAVMIGDDIVNDVAGAQACGIRGVLVRTGKYRPEDEPHATVKPDGYVDNLLQAIQLYMQHRR